jgi:catechol 2,3-dioxygenase-like lactoylglutathione lyase family enzyme
MTEGLKTVSYPVKDLAKATTLYRELLGVEPPMDEAYYVGFDVHGQHVGLDPHGYRKGMTGPVGHWHVDDIKGRIQAFLDAGAGVEQEPKDVGGAS